MIYISSKNHNITLPTWLTLTTTDQTMNAGAVADLGAELTTLSMIDSVTKILWPHLSHPTVHCLIGLSRVAHAATYTATVVHIPECLNRRAPAVNGVNHQRLCEERQSATRIGAMRGLLEVLEGMQQEILERTDDWSARQELRERGLVD